MATGAVSRDRDAPGRIELRQDRGQPLPSRLAGGGVVGLLHTLLNKRGATHVKQLPLFIQLPPRLTDIPHGCELVVDPRTLRPRLSAQSPSETVTIQNPILRKLPADQFCEGGQQIGGIDEIRRNLSSRNPTGPVCDHGDKPTAFEHGTFGSRHVAPADGGLCVLCLAGAVVPHEHDQRFVAQLEGLQFGDQFSNQLVHVADIVSEEVFAVRRAVRSGLDVGVNMHHRVVQEEGLGSMGSKEGQHPIVHEVRHVLTVIELPILTIDPVDRGFSGLLVAIETTAVEPKGVIESHRIGVTGKLAPLANGRGGVARRLENTPQLQFLQWHALTRILIGRAISKGIASAQDHRPRWAAQRCGERSGEARALCRQTVDVRSPVMIRTVTADIPDP